MTTNNENKQQYEDGEEVGTVGSILEAMQGKNEADFDRLYSGEELEMITELNSKQILTFSRALTFAERYNVPILEDFCRKYMELAISKNRSGRGELIESLKTKVLEPMGLFQDNNGKG